MDYEIVSTLNESHRVYVVRSKDDGKIYVQKQQKLYNASVYKTLAMHPVQGIPRIIDISEDTSKGLLTIVEEYISGRTLEEMIETEGAMSEKAVALHMYGLCQIVLQLHSFDPPIIHRDIKPNNVIIDEHGRTTLIDLNASKFAEKDQVRDTHLLGTPGYAAPEQLGFGASNTATDLYAIGMLMKALLTGDTSLSTEYKGHLRHIIAKCTALDPEKRYRNVRQLSDAIIRSDQLFARPGRLIAAIAMIPICFVVIIVYSIIKQTRTLPVQEWQKDTITAPVIEHSQMDQLCGSYKGSDGGGLTIAEDGSAIYYCLDRQYSEILCPWSYADGKITITLSKLHCDIIADTSDHASGKLLFTSNSRNWNDEVFEKLDDPSFSYESKALFAYDDDLTINPDGGYEFSAGGFTYHIPKHYADFADVTDGDKTRCIFIDSNADDLYSGQLYFFHDESFDDTDTLDDFFKGHASAFAMDFIDGIKTTDISSQAIGDSVIYNCTFTGIYNKGFSGMAGNDAGGIIVFMHKPNTKGIVKILMSQTTGRKTDLTKEFRDIITEAADH